MRYSSPIIPHTQNGRNSHRARATDSPTQPRRFCLRTEHERRERDRLLRELYLSFLESVELADEELAPRPAIVWLQDAERGLMMYLRLSNVRHILSPSEHEQLRRKKAWELLRAFCIATGLPRGPHFALRPVVRRPAQEPSTKSPSTINLTSADALITFPPLDAFVQEIDQFDLHANVDEQEVLAVLTEPYLSTLPAGFVRADDGEAA